MIAIEPLLLPVLEPVPEVIAPGLAPGFVPASAAELATLPLPARHSHSSLSTYAACPRKYAFNYVEHAPADIPAGWFTFGSLLHGAFESFDRARMRAAAGLGLQPAPGLAELETAFEAGLASGVDDAAQADGYRLRAWPAFNRYLAEVAAGGGVPVAVELGFGLDLAVDGLEAPVRLTGYLDRVDRLDDGSIQIVDHKTGRLRDQASVDADRQLTMYAYAAWRGAFPDPVTGEPLPAASRLGLRFAEPGITVWTERPMERLLAFEAQVSAEIRAIHARRFAARPGRPCDWCEYRALCPSALLRVAP